MGAFVQLSRRAFAAAAIVVAFGLAACLLGLGLGGRHFALWLGEALGGALTGAAARAAFVLAGGAVLAVDIALVLRALGLGASAVVEFENEAGRVSVDVAALEECLTRSALEDDGVTDAEASVRIARGGLGRPVVCNVAVGLRERADVPGKGKDLSANLKRRFLQIIPMDIDPVMNVEIRIREPEPDAESAKETQEMTVSELLPGGGPAPLPDTPDFTGERRYGKDDDASDEASGDERGRKKA